MKFMTLTILITLLTLRLSAPVLEGAIIMQGEPIDPFEAVWRAVTMVESSGDAYAYNSKEGATGIAQIRQVRIDDYNKRAGTNYRLSDMYNPELSKRVFMYYADPYDMDGSIMRWNGSGRQTVIYLNKVKNLL